MTHRIKSFVLRKSRMSPRQQRNLELNLPHYQLPQSPWDLAQIFPQAATVVVEIGFGMGASLITTAEEHPNIHFIGIEVHQPGIGALIAELSERGLTNVRVATFDAVDVITTCLTPKCIDGVHIFFPDPWPKKRHHKRRLIQPAFIAQLISRIKPQGYIHCATDWEDYALQMLEVLSNSANLKNQDKNNGFSPRPTTRPVTKFEQRGHRLGHGVWDLVFTVSD